MTKKLAVKRMHYRRRRYYQQSFQQRIIQAVGHHIQDETFGAKTLVQLRARFRKVVENDEFWKSLAELDKIGSKLNDLICNL